MERNEREDRLIQAAKDMADLYRSCVGPINYINVVIFDDCIYINNSYMDDDSERPIRVRMDERGIHHLDVDPFEDKEEKDDGKAEGMA